MKIENVFGAYPSDIVDVIYSDRGICFNARRRLKESDGSAQITVRCFNESL